jgi:hypothetical protein
MERSVVLEEPFPGHYYFSSNLIFIPYKGGKSLHRGVLGNLNIDGPYPYAIDYSKLTSSQVRK